ncbi:hypothetical protein D4R49_00965 [bacterium]|nr:MAG: hypothetical protein D4R49_00965 [bacterium]
MANRLDVSRGEASEILSQKKVAPHAVFRPSAGGQCESWELAVGVITELGLYKKALTIEFICQQSPKPHRLNYKFSLFLSEHGRMQRVYQLDTTSAPICAEGEHGWPHQHIGQDRVGFGSSYPVNFADSVAYFCKAANVEFEEPIESPFDFKLRP